MPRLSIPLMLILSLTLAFLTFTVPVGAARLGEDPDFGTDRVPVSSHADFACIVNVLQQLVDHRGRRGDHELYLSQVGTVGSDRLLRVYWPRDQSILLIFLSSLPCDERERQIADADWVWWDRKARIDLRTAVVGSQAEVETSTYLVSKAWVRAVIADCKGNGRRVTLRTSAHPKKAT